MKKALKVRNLQSFFQLDYQDSNLDKQNQNLLCYHYTIVQTLVLSSESDAKIIYLGNKFQIILSFFPSKVYVTG